MIAKVIFTFKNATKKMSKEDFKRFVKKLSKKKYTPEETSGENADGFAPAYCTMKLSHPSAQI